MRHGSDSVWLNGRLLSRAETSVSAFDRGFLYGDGFFETTRVLDGRAIFLDRHLDRLAASCRETGFGGDVDCRGLAEAVEQVIGANAVGDGYLRITLSRGLYRGNLAELAANGPTALVEARAMDLPPLDAAPPVVLAPSPYARNERSPTVRHKSLSYQGNVLALAEGRRRGADEVYFLNSRGRLAEGSFTNLFFVRGGVVRTPSVECGLLPGIGRQVVLEACGAEGIPAEEGAYEEAELTGAAEAFCTNSLRGVMPVGRLLDRPGARLSPGEVTRRLQRAFAVRAREGGG
jgi:branched-subunit amino acid aminotransferase/4-amino-4-deoxychorismate lyase